MAGGMIRTATVVGIVSGVAGTGVGGLAAAIWRTPGGMTFAAMIGFSGGMMLAVTAFDLLPEAFRAGPLFGAIGVVIGMAAMAWVDGILRSPARQELVAAGKSRMSAKARRLVRVGTIVGLGIAAHNVAEGLAIGSGYVLVTSFGLEMAIIIAIHNVPEGMAMATMLRLGDLGPAIVIPATLLAGLPMGLGSFVGAALGTISPAGLALSLGTAGGAMLFVTWRLFPEGVSLSYTTSLVSGTLLGLASGVFLVTAL